MRVEKRSLNERKNIKKRVVRNRFNFYKAHWIVQGIIVGLTTFAFIKFMQIMFLAAYVLAPESQRIM